MKEIRWDNPNKMHIESGFKLFDKQTNLITTGNVFANTQRSFYIAPWKETERNGRNNKEGELTKADLSFGRFDGNLPSNIKKIVYDQNRTEKIILYAFRVFKNGNEDIIGYVVTDDKYNYITHCISNAWTNASYSKREAAIKEAMKYICQ